MNKKEFIGLVTSVLKSNDIRKSVPLKKQELSIIDTNGNKANFVVKPDPKNVQYTIEDVSNIVDACIAVALDAIKRGEEIFFKGFGSLKLVYRAARRTKRPDNGDPCDVPAHYVPKFVSGNELKRAAKVFELNYAASHSDSGVSFYGEY